MNIDYFSKVKILDGGMGQALLSKGLKAKGSLWSTTALIEEKYHQLVIEAHLDFIKSGADVIVTNNFSARRTRMIENNVEEKFNLEINLKYNSGNPVISSIERVILNMGGNCNNYFFKA